ncbi:MAG: SRPBCC family protein [Opitutaceae bacterium]|nr:SRPBCC family protein [Opitutaceae bacterium]
MNPNRDPHMTAPNSPSTVPAGMEVLSSRIFKAPRPTVFDAFANPQHLPHWWGPKGFTNTFHEFDLRPGGAWRFTMHGPDGATYNNVKRFIEVAPPERIVFEHLGPMHRFTMTMTYDDVPEGTKLTWRMAFDPHADNAKLRNFIVEANEQNFDRLQAFLEKQVKGEREGGKRE